MLRKILFVVLFLGAIAPAVADTECPAGYQPAEYVELEYIESTGTQYIDTGVHFSRNNEFYFEFEKIAPFSNEDKGYGAGTNIRTDNIAGGGRIYNGVFEPWVFGNNLLYSPAIPSSDWYGKKYIETFTTYNNQISFVLIDNTGKQHTTQSVPIPSNWISTGNNVHLFRDNSSTYTYPSNDKIYHVLLKKDGEFIFDLVPTKRVSDGAIGMFDTVTQTFFENSGTGTFIAGPEKSDKKYIADNNITCVTCPANTYKPNVGNTQCIECPENTFSPVGSKNLTDCAKILHVGNYMAYMPVGRRTEHGLCTMLDGVKYCADLYEKE